jgi:hypothetical protein
MYRSMRHRANNTDSESEASFYPLKKSGIFMDLCHKGTCEVYFQA